MLAVVVPGSLQKNCLLQVISFRYLCPPYEVRRQFNPNTPRFMRPAHEAAVHRRSARPVQQLLRAPLPPLPANYASPQSSASSSAVVTGLQRWCQQRILHTIC